MGRVLGWGCLIQPHRWKKNHRTARNVESWRLSDSAPWIVPFKVFPGTALFSVESQLGDSLVGRLAWQVLEPDMEMQAHMDAETEGEANGCLVWRPIWVTDNMTYTACTGLYPKGQEWVLLLGTLPMALKIRVRGLIGTRYPVSLNAVEKLRDIIRFILITQTSPIRVFESTSFIAKISFATRDSLPGQDRCWNLTWLKLRWIPRLRQRPVGSYWKTHT